MTLLALACPLCALRPAGPGAALLVAGMMAAPFLVALVVYRLLKLPR